MPLFYISLGLGILVSASFIYRRSYHGANLSNLFLKTAASVLFVLTMAFATVANPDVPYYSALLMAGGVLGILGDVFLDLKYIYSKDSDTFLYAGFISFLLGHVFYICSVAKYSRVKFWVILASFALGIIVSLLNLAASKMMKLDFGKKKGIVFLYVIFLATTAIISLFAFIFTKDKSMLLMLAGGIAFLLSDAVLSMTYFGQGFDKPRHIFINHLLYYLAQYLIASSILFVR